MVYVWTSVLYCGVVVGIWDSYAGYSGQVVGVWNSYVGYCGVMVYVWDLCVLLWCCALCLGLFCWLVWFRG